MTRRYAPLIVAALVSALSLSSGLAQDAGTPAAGVSTDLFDPAVAEATPISGVATFTVESADHTEDPVEYAQDPPAGGPHAPAWQKCAAYDAPIRNENAVHSQEHGAVWITYQPDLPEAEVKALDKLAETRYVLVSPYPDLEDPIVASAWGAQLRLDAADDPRLGAFIERYAGNGPEPGANCDSGLETTIEDAG
ncbi:MAG: DUF3105 domain-containing protein [Chloroflexota bacterium]|nr:DUF3105 domain-containing protein [Chloroflexota bacterium]